MKSIRCTFLVLFAVAFLTSNLSVAASSEPRIISASLEVRTQSVPPCLKITEKIKIQYPPELLVRGFIRKFEKNSGPFFGAGPTKNYKFLSLSRQLVAPVAGEVIDLPLNPEVSESQISVKFGNDSYLVAGTYEYEFKYEAYNFLQLSPDKQLEGFTWLFLKEFPYPKDLVKFTVFPPDFVEPQSVSLSWATFSAIKDSDASSEISLSKFAVINLERHLFEKNSLKEGKPYGYHALPNGIGVEEAVMIRAIWPAGFIFKRDPA